MSEEIYVTRPSLPTMEEYMDELKDVWDSMYLTNMGKKHRKLQTELAKYLDAEYIDLFTNGHASLELSLEALELKGEVITTPFTFVSTTNAIVRKGLTPIFCDINSDDFTIDVSKIEELITDKTCAILPVHVYGNVCNVDEIERIAKKHNLKVIYDAAHAFGVKYKGRGIGSFGDVSCFSFHATKVFNTVEGGAVCFKDRKFGEKIWCLKNFGIRRFDDVDMIGTNAKMNEFSAAMGICNLRYIDDEIAKRKAVAERYKLRLSDVDGLKLPIAQKDTIHNFGYFPIVIDEKKFGTGRDKVFEELYKNGIYARKYFYPLTSDMSCFYGRFDSKKTPVASYISDRVLTIPIYADLKIEDVDRISDIILKCKR